MDLQGHISHSVCMSKSREQYLSFSKDTADSFPSVIFWRLFIIPKREINELQ